MSSFTIMLIAIIALALVALVFFTYSVKVSVDKVVAKL